MKPKTKRIDANRIIGRMKGNDVKRLLLAIHETLYPGGNPDVEFSGADFCEEIATLFERFGLGPEDE